MKCKCGKNIFFTRAEKDIIELRCPKCGVVASGEYKGKELAQDIKLKELK